MIFMAQLTMRRKQKVEIMSKKKHMEVISNEDCRWGVKQQKHRMIDDNLYPLVN